MPRSDCLRGNHRSTDGGNSARWSVRPAAGLQPPPHACIHAVTRWTSTPFGRRGFFYETWERVGREWLRVRVTAAECPRIAKAFLGEQRSVMGMEAFQREHMCEFVGGGLGAFERDLVEGALDNSVDY